MKKALMVLDLQNGILEQGDFSIITQKINELISEYDKSDDEVIFFRHINKDEEDNHLYYENHYNIDIICNTEKYLVLDKDQPSAFSNPNLVEILKSKKVEHIVIVGFNTEYCCLFTAINAHHEGYKVTFIEDATGTVNDEDTYEMKGLDINDFIGSILNWSNCIEVLYYDEYREIYQ